MQERAHQVRLMRTIYEKASRVIVWLGEASEDSGLGMNVVREIATPDDDEFKQRAMKVLGDEQEFRAVDALWDRPWWTRLWVVQEYTLAKTSP